MEEGTDGRASSTSVEEYDSGRGLTDACISSITFNISPDVGIVLSTSWQEEHSSATAADVQPFTVIGPPEALTLLMSERASQAGVLSPPVEVTLNDPDARRAAGIPQNAAFFAFAYPLESLAGTYERLVTDNGHCEPWLFFMLLGGYCYFDKSRYLICTNALTLTPAQARLDMDGPYQPGKRAIEQLSKARRLQPCTLKSVLDSGFRRFAWVNPGERPGGAPMMEDGSNIIGGGCFVYELEGGEAVLYNLVVSQSTLLGRLGLDFSENTAAKPQRYNAGSHVRLQQAMVGLAAGSTMAVGAAKRMQADLEVWRRTAVET